MKFTLTYEGRLYSSNSNKQSHRKHELRMLFHAQLRRLWETNEFLKNWAVCVDGDNFRRVEQWLPENMPVLHNVRFVPLVTRSICAECALEFRILAAPSQEGQRTDIDNYIKMLVDALKMPKPGQIEAGMLSRDGNLIYVLVEDDELIKKITSISDVMLSPICGKDSIERNDARIQIDVYISPSMPNHINSVFYSGDDEVWLHMTDNLLQKDFSKLDNGDLASEVTQCIYRIRALSNSLGASSRLVSGSPEAMSSFLAHAQIWKVGLWPEAYSLQQELLRRIFGEPPYPSDSLSVAIDHGILAGVNPLQNAAIHLEKLVRRL